MRSNRVIWIVIFVIIAVIAYAAARGSGNERGQGTVDEALRYSNPELGVSFSYPKEYVLEERERENGERGHYAITLIRESDIPPRGVVSDGPPAITLDFFQNDLDKQTAVDFVTRTNNSNYKLGDGKIATTTVSGREALRYSWDGLYQGESTVFLHKNNVVMASVTSNSPSDDIKRDFETILRSVMLSD